MKRSYMFRMFYFVMRAGRTDEINKYREASILKILILRYHARTLMTSPGQLAVMRMLI